MQVMKPRKLLESEVTFEVTTEPEDIDPEDCFDDPRVVASVREKLESGDDAAWCIVLVEAKWKGYRGHVNLGACTLDDDYTEETVATEYGMRANALDALNKAIAATYAELEPLLETGCRCETCKRHDAALASG